MRITTVVVLAGALLGSNSAAYAQTRQNAAELSSGTAFNATLSKPIDARKNKPGDPVTAKTTEATKSNGQVVITKGSKLVGHVTESKARSKGEHESTLGIAFDKAILKNGQEVPLNVTIQALAAAQSVAPSSVGSDDLAAGPPAVGGAGASGRSSGGVLGGVGSASGGAAGVMTNATGSVGGATNTAGNVGGLAGGALNSTANSTSATRGAAGGLNTAGQLTSNSQGVFGLNGLNLNSAASNSTQGSLITSTSKNVHLDSGTQLLLVTQSQAAAGTSNQ
jgi:hypothetical protein